MEELPNLTKTQKEIIDFWKIRGYEELHHCLGLNISLHKKPRYKYLGLSLQYLEQFKRQAKKEVYNKIERFVLEEVKLSEDRLIDYALIVDFIEKEKKHLEG